MFWSSDIDVSTLFMFMFMLDRVLMVQVFRLLDVTGFDEVNIRVSE